MAIKCFDKDTKDVISQMTLDEKARLVNGATFFGSFGIDRLDIPRLQLLDGGTGINFEQLFGDFTEYYDWHGYCGDGNTQTMNGTTMLVNVIENYYEPEKLSEDEKKLYDWIKEKIDARLKGNEYAPACLPPGILLGATWNPEVVGRVGEALGMEASLFGVHILLGTPNVNIHRDPLNGRLFEGYSEEPCLVTKLAPELVKGVQKYGVAANVKHFAANNQETNRVGINETISNRALEEIYFPGFKACVKDGNVQTVMSAYNKINGTPCTENSWLLKDKLRNEWGFNGTVMSDWGAVYNQDKALLGGNDLEMPGPGHPSKVLDSVEIGTLSEKNLDEAVFNILKTVKWIADNYVDNIDVKFAKEFTDKAAYDAAAEGIVLLENNNMLPLNKSDRVVIVGSGAKKLLECGQGSAGINTNRVGDVSKSLSYYLGTENVRISEEEMPVLEQDEKAICICSLGGMEGNDRKNLMLDVNDDKLLEYLMTLDNQTCLVLNTCGPVDLRKYKNSNIKSILAMFLPGMAGASALADILVGEINPSGKLPLTFPDKYEDTPTFINFPGDGYEVNYGEGIFVGYRYYDKKKITPAYAFGYGLSYTTFDIRLKEIKCDYKNSVFRDECDIILQITNTGKRAGSEVVQLYVNDPVSTLTKPQKELKDFVKVYLEVGETKEIIFNVDKDMLSSYDADLNKWTCEEGYYNLYIATSSFDRDIVENVQVYLDTKSPYSYSIETTVKVICENEELRTLAFSLWEEYGWDVGIIKNCYQYTSNKSLKEIIPDIDKVKYDEFIKSFNEKAYVIIKQ